MVLLLRRRRPSSTTKAVVDEQEERNPTGEDDAALHSPIIHLTIVNSNIHLNYTNQIIIPIIINLLFYPLLKK